MLDEIQPFLLLAAGRIRESLAERRFPNRLRARGWLGGHFATVEHGKPVWKPALRRSTKNLRMRSCQPTRSVFDLHGSERGA
jgi:hypothetical protein